MPAISVRPTRSSGLAPLMIALSVLVGAAGALAQGAPGLFAPTPLRPLAQAQADKLVKLVTAQGEPTTVSAEVATALGLAAADRTMHQLALEDRTQRVHAVNLRRDAGGFLFAVITGGDVRVYRVERDFRLTGAVRKPRDGAAAPLAAVDAKAEVEAELEFWAKVAEAGL